MPYVIASAFISSVIRSAILHGCIFPAKVVCSTLRRLIGCPLARRRQRPLVNHLDLSPHFAGVMLSLTNFAGSVGSVLTPVATGLILKDDPTAVVTRKGMRNFAIWKLRIGVRFIQMLYMFASAVVMGFIRGSIGVAVLAMNDATRRDDTYIQIHHWDRRIQGAILSSFFFGYALMLLPAELYFKRIGGKL
ncbi:Sodium-dependent phosphate transporter, partial [Operophtera brumata]